PLDWMMKLGGESGVPLAESKKGVKFLGIFWGMATFILQLPLLLSLFPGVLRACVRIKSILPESIVPGWFLVFTAPFYLLFWFMVFILVKHAANHPLLVLGVVLFVGAPSVYVITAGLFIRPLPTLEEQRRLTYVQVLYSALGWAGGICLIIYAFAVTIP